MRVDVFEAVDQADVAVAPLHLHPHFKHIGGVSDRAGNRPRYHSTAQIDGDTLFPIIVLYNNPLKRVVRTELNCTVCGLAQHRWPYTEKQRRTYITGKHAEKWGLL